VLGALEQHYVIVAIGVASLVVLAAVILAIRRGRVFRRHRRRPIIIPGRVEAVGGDARAVLEQWASDRTHPSARATAMPEAKGAEEPVESTEIDQLLKLADLFERNLLSRQEFEEEKSLLLGHDSARGARSSGIARSSGAGQRSSEDEPKRK